MPNDPENSLVPKRCFVIMGFGIKTDFATGRKLDLNKSYKLLIKPVVENKGIVCIRADEILHSGSIDYQMYKELYNADLVIADLSTANVNAFYELGIRHALRSRTTIVISEDQYSYPFDLNHIKITNYTHLGEAIDYEEVERFRKVLGETIDTVLNIDDPDSPVYSNLPDLNPPLFKTIANLQNNFVKEILKDPDQNDEVMVADKKTPDNPTLGNLIELGETALYERQFAVAKTFFQSAIQILRSESKDGSNHDSYLIHRLAFATYKAKVPDLITSLKEAIQLLSKLDIEHTNDTETVSLAGRIEKKLFEKGQGDQHLANAIQFYQRGYFLLHNRYHGINLAFLYNKRVDTSIFNTREDKIADMIFANRIRRQVLEMCEKDWNIIMDRKNRIAIKSIRGDAVNFSDYNAADDIEQMFWIQVNKAECHYCLGEIDEFKRAVARAKEIEHADWMMEAYEKQFAEVQTLFQRYGNLLNPPWSEF
jgi:tetratricopeptide (TPR) repeat protein